MNHAKTGSVDMLHGPMLKKMLFFAIPLAAGSILQQLFNAVDVAVVGRFASSEALAAVGANSSVVALFINLFVGVSVGSNVVIAQMIGRGKPEHVDDAVHTSMVLSVLGGLALMFIGIFMAKPILTWMATPENIMDMSIRYLRIYCVGMPFIMVYNFTAAILRSIGDTKRPLYCLIIGGVVNALLNMFLVIVCHMDVEGVAIATVVSNLVSAGFALYFLQHSDEMLRVQISKLGIKKEVLLPMLKIGIPSGIQGVVFSISNICIQSSINSFGSDAVAGSTIGGNFEILSYFMVNGFNQAVMTFIGQNLGAGNKKRCLRAFGIGMICAIIAASILNYTIFFAQTPIVAIFTTDTAVAAYAFERMRYVLVFHCMIATYEITGAAMRGLGKSIVPSLISIFGTCLFRLIYINTVVPAHHEYHILMSVYPISWVLTGSVTILAFVIVWKKFVPKLIAGTV